MSILKLLLTGLAGSSALTGLHEGLKHKENAPRVDLLGKQAVSKFIDSNNEFSDKKLYWSSMAGDILSNSALYSIIAKTKNPIFSGALVGGIVGLATLATPNLLGLNGNHINSNDRQKVLTFGYYLFGGVVAGVVAQFLKKDQNGQVKQ